MLFIFTATTAYLFSQNNDKPDHHKQNSFALEFSLGKTDPSDQFGFENLMIKYAFKNNLTVRLGMQAKYFIDAVTEDDYEQPEYHMPIYYESSFSYGILPGIQYAVITKPKFNTYIGMELSLFDKFTEAKYIDYYEYEEVKMINTVTGSWRGQKAIGYGYVYTYDKERGFQTLGGKLVFGSEFYPYEKLYLGFEFAYGYERKSYDVIVSEVSVSDAVNVTNDKTEFPSMRTYYTGFYSNNMIHVGIRF
jgi:hypothetical protein